MRPGQSFKREIKTATPVTTPLGPQLEGFTALHLPGPHREYDRFNNDLEIEHYLPAVRSYSGAQRKGIVEPFPQTQSYMEHISEALQAPFPLAGHTPLPADLLTALKFNRDNPRETVREFQRSQMKQLRKIAHECKHDTERWYRFTPDEIKSSTGTIHITLLAHLTRFARMKGANWLMQFVVGFPIAGALGQEGVFPLSGENPQEPLNVEQLYQSKSDRFRARAPRAANSRSPQELWDEALSQVAKGWLEHPRPLSATGDFADPPFEEINTAFRFGVRQSGKLRGCDDFKDSLTNRRCRITTPITLPGWGHITSASRILSTRQCAWAFGKVDHEATYKALPLRPADARHAVIALWDNTTKAWFGFKPKTLLFGSAAAVLHYNCLSRLLASLACRILMLPTIGYFGDFGFFAYAPDSAMDMATFSEFCSLLGLSLKMAKSSIGTRNTFLGISAHFPAPTNRMTLTLALTPEKASTWASLIDRFIAEGHISHAQLEALIGRLGFAQTAVFGRFARAMIKPLYTKLYAKRYNSAIAPPLMRNLRWWGATLMNIIPRVVAFDRSNPDWVLYTDAAFDSGPQGARIAALFFRTHKNPPHHIAEVLVTGRPNQEELKFFSQTSTIFGLELIAIVLAVYQARATLRNKAIVIYTDNNSALAALIKGDSTAPAAFSMIALFWFLAATYNIAIWMERVETKRNIADLPTRGV